MIKPIQKNKPIRLKGKALERLRHIVYLRDCGCCTNCGKWLPLIGDVFTRAHLAHKKSRGSGGSDTEKNTHILCYNCHIGKEHSPQWSKK